MSVYIIGAIGLAALVLYGLGRAGLTKIEKGGRAEEKALRAEADLAVAQKQAEIMAQHKDRDDVLSDLERGDF
jgi:hypothetical protein